MNGTIASVGNIGGSTPTPTPTYRVKCSNGRVMFFVDVNVNTITTFAELAQYIVNNGCISEYQSNNDSVTNQVATLPCVPAYSRYSSSVTTLSIVENIFVKRNKTGAGAWSQWWSYVGILRVDIIDESLKQPVTAWMYANDTSGDWSLQYV